MVSVKQGEEMGESTTPKRILLEEVVLKDKSEGEEMETDWSAGTAAPSSCSLFSALYVVHTEQFVHNLHEKRGECRSWRCALVASLFVH